jgi:predicted phosphoadenosine phosphosulfate sulfurtransferase
MQFDRDGIEIITQEEQVNRAFKHAITYINNHEEEVLVNHVNVEHMKLMLAIRERQLRKVYHKITVFVNGFEELQSRDATAVIQCVEKYSGETCVERIDLKYERE